MDLKKKSIPKLKEEADKWTSLYVRQKAADWKGNCRCYTCFVEKPWKEMQAGHYVSRVYNSTRWFLPNIKVQCYSCNVMKKGNMDEFSLRLEAETPGILKELNNWKHRPATPLKKEDLIAIIDFCKNNLKK